MERTYHLSTSAPVADVEWATFKLADPIVGSLRDVRFKPVGNTHSELTVLAHEELDTLALDAAVERFREQLARKGLSGEAAAGNPY
jgi:hypothetical protein